MSHERRKFLKQGLAAAAAAGTLSAPAIVRADSKKTYHLKMTSAYPPGSPFYTTGPGSATDFIERVEAMSGGRIKIKFFAAGALIPALGGFDAVREGTVDMNWANAYFWAGKSFAAQFFTNVPFGMDVLGTNAWLSQGGGQALWDELYAPFGLKAFAAGNTGMQMTGWFRKPINSIDDFKGLRMRIPGLAGKVYEQLGVSVKLLPGGEIFPALQRGVIDAAEFVGPYLDRKLGLMNAAKHYYTPGWHEPNNVTELLVNKKLWDEMPKDLQSIIANAAAACNEISFSWCNANNAAALKDLVDNHGVKVGHLSPEIIKRLREVTFDTLATLTAKEPEAKKIYDHYFGFKKQVDDWLTTSEAIVLAQNL
ncbi:MAG: ABC transporter substrate-binding protein [Gammaproteobacteria bacterium]|nr:ABC transporter substrate-binding protein [Gammaproteobacteria bacterium]